MFTDKAKSIFTKGYGFLRSHPQIHFVLIAVVLAVLFYAPYSSVIPGDGSTNTHLAIMVTYAIAALGINLLLGFSGLISLATAGFMGVGALGLVVLMNDFPIPFSDSTGLPFFVAMLVILTLSGVLGALVGIISLRVQGIYLAITTLFVAQILHTFFTNYSRWFGDSGSGIRLEGSEPGISGLLLFGGRVELIRAMPYSIANTFNFDRYYLLLMLTGALLLVMIVTYHIIKSRTGRAFMAMSRSYNAAQAMGINVVKYRVMSFVIATMIASFAGIMFAVWNQSVANDRWSLMISLTVIAVVVVGGLKSITGTLIGAFVIYAFPRIFLDFLTDFNIVGGLLIVLVILFYPNGLVHIAYDVRRLIARIRMKLFKKGRVNVDD